MSAHTAAGRAAEKRAYERMRAVYFERFRECVETASTIAINHNLSSDVAADIEGALLQLASRLLP